MEKTHTIGENIHNWRNPTQNEKSIYTNGRNICKWRKHTQNREIIHKK